MLPNFPFKPLNNKPEPLGPEEEWHPEPKSADGNKEIADAHLTKGQLHAAITRYKKAAHMDNDPAHRTDLGDAYAFAEMPIKAMQQYKKAIKSNPNRPEGHFSLAEVYVRYGKWQAAAVEYLRAVELAPNNAYYRYKLAHAYIQAGCKEDAIEHMEVAVSLCSKDAFYHFELATLYADVRQDRAAVNEMEHAAALVPDDYYVARLAMLYARVEEFEKSADMYREAIRLSPRKLAYHCLLGDIYHRLGYQARAESQYGEASEIDSYEADFVERARRITLGGIW